RILHRCQVGRAEYTAPEEQQGQPPAQLTFDHDTFALAVLLFQLLMEGIHPFAGRFIASGEDPPIERRIAEGFFPYCRKLHGPVFPAKFAVPFYSIHTELRDLFVRSFEDGHADPTARPSATEWRIALDTAEGDLCQCLRNEQHWYSNHVLNCPWCERAERFGL